MNLREIQNWQQLQAQLNGEKWQGWTFVLEQVLRIIGEKSFSGVGKGNAEEPSSYKRSMLPPKNKEIKVPGYVL